MGILEPGSGPGSCSRSLGGGRGGHFPRLSPQDAFRAQIRWQPIGWQEKEGRN